MKRGIRLLALALSALVLASCAPSDTGETPLPAPTPVPYVPVGDAMVVPSLPQVLYYLSRDGTRLMPKLSAISVMPSETLVEAVLVELLRPPQEEGLEPVFPVSAGVVVLDVEHSQDLVTVNLTGRFSSLVPSQIFSGRAAIVNTLTELADVRFVNILFDGRAEAIWTLPGGAGIPTGASARYGEDLSAGFLQMQGEQAGEIVRQAVLYFASPQGDMLLTEVREITLTWDNPIQPIIEELSKGPTDAERMRRTLPSGNIVRAIYTVGEADGRTIIEINLRPVVLDFIGRGELDAELVFASLTRSIMAFAPGIAGVRFLIEGRRLSGMFGSFTEDYEQLGASAYSVEVGRSVPLFYPAPEGRVQRVMYPFTQRDAASPRAWLRQIFLDAPMPFPPAWGEEAVLGIAMLDDVAQVNLSREAADSLAGISALDERAYLYALINTLCGAPGVKRVSFLVEGVPVDTLGGTIRLEEPLMPNPGIVLR